MLKKAKRTICGKLKHKFRPRAEWTDICTRCGEVVYIGFSGRNVWDPQKECFVRERHGSS